MNKMTPWVRKFWESLSEDDKRTIARGARVICNAATIDTGRDICRSKVEELSRQFRTIAEDMSAFLNDESFTDSDIVPYSQIEFLTAYFAPFAELYPDDFTAPVSTRRKFLVRNGFHGDIVCELASETAGSYFFDYIKDGIEVFKDWRVLKSSGRVLKEVF